MSKPKPTVSTAEAAAALHVSTAAVKQWCASGLFQGAFLEHNPRGSVWRIPLAALATVNRPTIGRPRRPDAEKKKLAKRARKKSREPVKGP